MVVKDVPEEDQNLVVLLNQPQNLAARKDLKDLKNDQRKEVSDPNVHEVAGNYIPCKLHTQNHKCKNNVKILKKICIPKTFCINIIHYYL